MQIIFCDLNKSLVDKVTKAIKYLPVEVACDDIFNFHGVIVSASNPKFNMGGGLDALIKKHYPDECSRVKPGKNQRIGNVIFTITVDDGLKASRELVGKALKFALSKTKESETVLISGLGTGIGGLDEDDFVWLFLQAVCEKYKYGWGIKYADKTGCCFYCKSNRVTPIKFKVGQWVEQPGAIKDGRECEIGIHLGKSFVGAGNYNVPETIYFCLFHKEDLCGEGNDKYRVSKTLVLAELPLWLGYGINGKKILPKIGKKFNPEKYNPYQATKLPSEKVLKKFLNQIGDQVRDQVWNQVGNQVWDQVGGQVRNQVWGQVRNQVWDQVDVTSYWAINVHFDLGITHRFSDFLKLGVLVIFVNGKINVFGKKGKFLGEYDDD